MDDDWGAPGALADPPTIGNLRREAVAAGAASRQFAVSFALAYSLEDDSCQ